MKLVVEFLTGKKIEIDCDTFWTVGRLKEAVQIQADLKTEFCLTQTTVRYSNYSVSKILGDTKATLGSYLINSQSTITCVLKVQVSDEDLNQQTSYWK